MKRFTRRNSDIAYLTLIIFVIEYNSVNQLGFDYNVNPYFKYSLHNKLIT